MSTPSQSDLIDRAHELRDQFDDQDEIQGLTSFERKVQRFLEDVLDELESV